MKKYLKLPAKIVIPSHGYVTDKKLIEANLKYLESFPEIEIDMYTEESKQSFLNGTLKNFNTIAEDFFAKEEFEKAEIYYEKIASIHKEENILQEEKEKMLEIRLKEIKERL